MSDNNVAKTSITKTVTTRTIEADFAAVEQGLAEPDTPLQDGKQRLLQLIVEQGILHDTEQHPVIARDGETRLSWVMNFLAISLCAGHLKLAARQMLALLEDFEGRQLATIGTAAVPLLSACILESAGKYSGLMVRAKRKAYGTASLIDGRINRQEPVIVIDDSIGSGTNMLDCIDKLEQAGLYVEGCACLVRFGYDSGYARLVERGYKVVALFDNARDIAAAHPADWQYDPYPVKTSFNRIVWDDESLPDYLSPFSAIRGSIRHFWKTGKLLKPPQHFNQPLDTSGGIWLSLRAQDALHTSQSRHGFWHFPEDADVSSPPLDVSRAAWLFANHLQNDAYREQRLEQCAFGLSLFGELEICQPGDFEQQYHALALRSTESPWKMGGALPNMPGISSDAHLLHHARFNNTQLFPREPYQLYRHTVSKLVEPGAEWPCGGVGAVAKQWDEQQNIIEPLAGILMRCVQFWHLQGTWPKIIKQQYIPVQCQWLFLSVYLAGKQLACVGITPQQTSDLLHLVKTAAEDERWIAARAKADAGDEAALYIRLSLLSQDTYLGQAASLADLSHFVRGQDSIAIQGTAIQDDEQFALMLPEIPLEQQWDTQQLNDALYQKAGIQQQIQQQNKTEPVNQPAQPRQAIHWRSYRTVCWHAGVDSCQRLSAQTRLPEPQKTAPASELIAACQHFLSQHQQADGIINSHYHPVLHQVYQQDTLFNTAHVLSVLGADQPLADKWQASYHESYRESYRFLEQGLFEAGVRSVTYAYGILTLLTRLQYAPAIRPLIAQLLPMLQESFNRHGQLPHPDQETDTDTDADHYGIELYALLRALQDGFYVDTQLLHKGMKHLVRYAGNQATARQYPVLLQTFALAKTLAAEGAFDTDMQLETTIAGLVQDLLQWQQPAGVFLPEAPHLSPAIFTARALHAMLDVGMVSTGSLEAGVDYLQQQLVQPAHQHFFANPEYAIGGMHSGLLDGCLPVALSAQFLTLLRRIQERDGADG